MDHSKENSMEDRHRVIVMRLRLNQAESQALAKLTAATGLTASDLLRGFIHQAAAAN
jgi:hypothetical protein